MKLKSVNLFGKAKDASIDADPSVFQAVVRPDIMSTVVRWQFARAQSGNHDTKERGEIAGSCRKPHKQKGTGRARMGDLKSPHHRSGGVAFGPTPRSHAFDVPKKVRKIALRSALSLKVQESKLFVMPSFNVEGSKTKLLKDAIAQQGWKSVLFIDGETVDNTLKLASSNLHTTHVLPTVGANVVDILKRDVVILSAEAVEKLQARLK